MCEPTTILLGAGVAMSAAGMGMSAYGQYQQGKAARAQANFQAGQDEYNAQATEGKIEGVLLQEQLQAQKLRNDTAGQIGEGRAALAGGNVDLSTGTPVFWEVGMNKALAQDLAINRYNASQEEGELRTQAWNYRMNAGSARASGSNAMAAGRLGATSSLLAGAGQSALSFSNYYARK